MSLLPPQTISLKRRRTEAPVDALRFDQTDSIKRRKNEYAYRRLTKPNDAPTPSTTSQVPPTTPMAERRFQLEAASATGGKRVFVEARPTPPPPPQQQQQQQQNYTVANSHSYGHPPQQAPTSSSSPSSTTPRPRKRPGAASALGHASKPSLHNPIRTEPSKDDLRKLEALSQEVANSDNPNPHPTPSPSKYKPRAPALRFAQRNPHLTDSNTHPTTDTATDTANDTDPMDLDTDDFVIDTYIREPLAPNTPLPLGTVGLLVLSSSDDDWWNGSDTASEEFDTDDADENAEDYYANDYPEDELSEDDEAGRHVYQKKYRRGSDEEEWGIGLDADEDDDGVLGSGEDEDDLHYRMTVPKVKRAPVGYWGTTGETL